MRGGAIPRWCGSSTRCVGGSPQQPSRTLRTSLWLNSNKSWETACSSAHRMWTTCTSGQGRSASSTCYEHLRSSSGASPVRVWRTDSPAHLLVRRGAVRTGSHLQRTGRMQGLHGCGHVRRGRASSELRRPSSRACANHLRGAGGTCERIRLRGMPLGESGRGIARPAQGILHVVKGYCSRAVEKRKLVW